jgi:ArsR family transcriptional regulator, lead/cadmium/zinc/bismuth-responsive transcriptional repressor
MESERASAGSLNALVTMLIDEIHQLSAKLDILIDLNQRSLKIEEHRERSKDKVKGSLPKKAPDALALIALPASLQKTLLILYQVEKATAEDLAKETKRLRAVESAAANQLVRLGYIKKRRQGRDVFFYIEPTVQKQEGAQ